MSPKLLADYPLFVQLGPAQPALGNCARPGLAIGTAQGSLGLPRERLLGEGKLKMTADKGKLADEWEGEKETGKQVAIMGTLRKWKKAIKGEEKIKCPLQVLAGFSLVCLCVCVFKFRCIYLVHAQHMCISVYVCICT